MKLSHILKSSYARFLLFFGRTTPLRVTHVITHRCNLKCRFCELPGNGAELTTEEIKEKMRAFKSRGTIAWGFTGGEPLVRKDLPELIRFAKKECNFITSLVTNGTLVERFLEIGAGDLDFLMVSLEGKKESNDKIRGAGSFDKALATVKNAKAKGIGLVSVDCIILDDNIEDVKFLMRLAGELDIYYGFQPVFDMATVTESRDVAASEQRTAGLIRNIQYLLSVEDKRMLTSKKFLDYCLNYGKKEFVKNICFAGRLYCQMMPDGSLRNCWWRGAVGVTDFRELQKPAEACYCWPQCHAEYSSVFAFNFDAVYNLLSKFHF